MGFGLLLLIVPGLIAHRQVGEWRTGHRYRPRLAWALGALALWSIATAVLLATPYRGVVALAVLSLPPAIWIATRD